MNLFNLVIDLPMHVIRWVIYFKYLYAGIQAEMVGDVLDYIPYGLSALIWSYSVYFIHDVTTYRIRPRD